MHKNHAYGFQWNNLNVFRVCCDSNNNSILMITTDKQKLEVRVTAKGTIIPNKVFRRKNK